MEGSIPVKKLVGSVDNATPACGSLQEQNNASRRPTITRSLQYLSTWMPLRVATHVSLHLAQSGKVAERFPRLDFKPSHTPRKKRKKKSVFKSTEVSRSVLSRHSSTRIMEVVIQQPGEGWHLTTSVAPRVALFRRGQPTTRQTPRNKLWPASSSTDVPTPTRRAPSLQEAIREV